MLRKHEFGLLHRVQLHAARQIALDLQRLGISRTAQNQPGTLLKLLLHGRLRLCHSIL